MEGSASGQQSSWSEGSPSQPQTITWNNGTTTVRGFEIPGSSSSAREPLGPHRASVGPMGMPLPTDHEYYRRRPSFRQRIGSIGDAGGHNSFNKFAASWQRAAGFYGITPSTRSGSSQLPAGIEQEDEDGDADLDHGPTPIAPPPRESLLKAALENDRRGSGGHSDPDIEEAAAQSPGKLGRKASAPGVGNTSEFEPSLAGPQRSSYGAVIGSIDAGRRFSGQRTSQGSETDKERQPLLRKRKISEDGLQAEEGLGESTLPQTIFNSVNVLIGVGMLSLPLAFRYAGWVIGLGFFLFSTVATQYTAKVLGKCLDTDPTLVTFSDIAWAAFGGKAQFGVSVLFSVELTGACVALIILFADNIDLLATGTGLSLSEWKIVCGIILIPLSFLPLRFLSFTSILGIGCCLAIILAVFIDGFVKDHAIGSLLDPATTYLFPKNWNSLPLAFGILMAPWGGHSVFPNIYRDMRHPKKYHHAVHITFLFTYVTEVALAIAGYLMFGEGVKDEITKNIFLTEGYPRWLSIIIIVAITIVPLTKVPLTARPIISIFEVYFGVAEEAKGSNGMLAGSSRWKRRIVRMTIRLIVPVLLVIVAILVPSFERVMSFLGALACFSICMILPCAFHLKIFGKELSVKTKILDWSLLISCTVLATVGTVFACFPKETLGLPQE